MSFITDTRVPRARLTGDYIPTSFEDMYAYYYEFVVANVISQGIDPQNAEDVAQAILIRFYERKSLEHFDPEYVTVHEGVERRAVFRTFLSGFVLTYVKHHRSMQHKRVVREGVSLDRSTSNKDGVSNETTIGDLIAVVDEDPGYVEAEARQTIAKIRAHLAALPPVNSQDLCDMPAFFDQIQLHAEAYGRPNITELAAHFGVSKVSIQTWLKRLRREVSKVR